MFSLIQFICDSYDLGRRWTPWYQVFCNILQIFFKDFHPQLLHLTISFDLVLKIRGLFLFLVLSSVDQSFSNCTLPWALRMMLNLKCGDSAFHRIIYTKRHSFEKVLRCAQTVHSVAEAWVWQFGVNQKCLRSPLWLVVSLLHNMGIHVHRPRVSGKPRCGARPHVQSNNNFKFCLSNHHRQGGATLCRAHVAHLCQTVWAGWRSKTRNMETTKEYSLYTGWTINFVDA